MIPYGFYKENKQKINSLCEKYKTCEIIFLNMGRKYKNWKTNTAYYAKSVYYRLSLSDLVTDFDKIIYLDCDTMVHSDLTNFYNIEMGDKCYMGFPGLEISRLEINGTRNFINSGVMLINLKMLRSVKASLLFSKYYYTYGTTKVDEYLINVIFYNRISFLPLEYGIPDFENGTTLIQSPSYFWNSFKGFLNGTEKEMISASNNRIITHGAFRYDKWWNRSYDSLSNIGKKWIYYASKSNVFNEICDIFIQYKTICSKIK
jgi:lipopolysaccharide biosynthesis glycosyltransferase